MYADGGTGVEKAFSKSGGLTYRKRMSQNFRVTSAFLETLSWGMYAGGRDALSMHIYEPMGANHYGSLFFG